jgi:hypothetical protein
MTMPTTGGDAHPDQPAYVDPITGAPLYVDPATGELQYGSTAIDPAVPTTPLPATPPLPATVPLRPGSPDGAPMPAAGYGAPGVPHPYDTIPAGYPPTGFPRAPGGFAYPIGAMPYGAPNRTNGMAIASLVVSICSLTLLTCYGAGAIVGLVGAILGHIARRHVRERNENGGGMALAGIICGWISVAIGIVIVIFVVWIINQLSTMDYSD